MSALLIYGIKTAIVISVFYLCYRMLVRKNTFHNLNRIALISTVILSFILPLCVITTTQIVVVENISIPQTINPLPTEVVPLNNPNKVNNTINLLSIFGIIYAIGVVAMSIYLIISIIKVRALIKHCEVVERDNNINIYSTTNNITPCSWFNNIILSATECDNERKIIITHETAHIKLGHSWDLTLINLCRVLQWFNPVIWLLSADLKEIHEYQADEQVINEGVNVREYQLLLIKKAVGNKSYSIANNLNHSKLKNRITMMLSKKSSVASRLKLLYILPLIGVSLTVFAQEETILTTKDKDNKKQQIAVSPIASVSINAWGKYGKCVEDSNSRRKLYHNGIDLKVDAHTPVVAVMNGTVKKVGYDSNGKGNYIIISHSDGYETEYAHLASCDVSQGKTVQANEKIGVAGSTGKSTDVHLHFEVRQNGTTIDPVTILATSIELIINTSEKVEVISLTTKTE